MHRFVSPGILCLLFLCCCSVVAQVSPANQNLNMVSGTDRNTDDPFLQLHKPSVAVSTRNDVHLVTGSHDYRTVDLPGLPGIEERGDAWLGVVKSFDGGPTWEQHVADGISSPSFALGAQGREVGVESSESSPIFGSRGLF
jgi:hypothetical protein